MRDTLCSYEDLVAKAVRTGLWESTVRNHTDTCSTCHELVLSINAMQSLGAGVGKESQLPNAGWLWRKALLERKQVEADQVRRPLRLAQFAAVLAGMLVLGAWIGWNWRPMQVQVAVWQVELWSRLWQAFWSLEGTSPLISRGPLLVLLLALAALLAQPVLAEE
jgi:hypothetical protein